MSNPEIPNKGPYIRELSAGDYKWCSCGKSSKQPYCDGSHKGTDFSPISVQLTEDKKVAWCGCKHSSNKPFCDGAHRNI